MKVLHIITGLNAGGAERALYNLLQGGLAARFDSHVLSLSGDGVYGDRMRALGVSVHSLGMRRGLPTPGALFRLRKLVRGIRPDRIQGWMYHGNLAAWLAHRWAPGRPMLAWNVRQSLYDLVDEKPLTRQVIRANRRLSGAPAVVIYNSRVSRRQHESFGFAGDRGRVLPNGFDTGRLAPDAVRALAMRRQLDLPEDAIVVGHLARYHPMKNHQGFIRAAVRLAEEGSDFHVVMAGRGIDDQNDALGRLLPATLRPRFRLLGEREEAFDLIRAMDVLCVSSAWGEAFPNVIGEAMAAGVPCVTTDVGDSAFIVGDTGIVVPPRDEDALKEGLRDMLERSTGERKTMGERAMKRVEAEFDLSTMVDRYTALYEMSSHGGGLETGNE